MDLNTVRTLRPARSRADLVLAPGETLLAGGSWLFSEPQPGTSGLVDLTTLGWDPWVETSDGLSIAATCTVADLRDRAAVAPWRAARLFAECVDAFLMSFKIQNTATVGGNLCLALPAGAMITLAVALGADVVVWTPDGGERREPAGDFVLGVGRTTLAPGEVLRSIEIPASALAARTALRKAALTRLGRSSAIVTGRLDGEAVLTVTASTTRPHQLTFPAPPSERDVLVALSAIDDWYDDAHGAPDWRAAVTRVLALEVLAELAP